MTTTDLIDRLAEHFDKELNLPQIESYREALTDIGVDVLPKLRKDLIAKCKRFPSVAEILDCAREYGHGSRNNTASSVVSWSPTDCRNCGGSGMVAALWLESFRDSADGQYQVRIMDRMQFGPYQGHLPFLKRHPEYQSTVFRCDCGANRGAIGGLPLFRLEIGKTETPWSGKSVATDGKTIGELRSEFSAMLAEHVTSKANQMPGYQPRQPRPDRGSYQREPGDEMEEYG